MPKITNISPFGSLDVPLLRRVVDAGETVDVTENHARILLLQPANYEPADEAAKALAADLAASQDPAPADTPPVPHEPVDDAAGAAQEAAEAAVAETEKDVSK